MDAEPIVRIATADGASIAVKRKPCPGGSPLIMLHGLAVNADIWNLPDIQGDGFQFRSLATLALEAGFDVYLVNWRGLGAPDMLSVPAPGQDDWCVDDFILYDLPAVVDYVIEQTGRKPLLIGSSMGSMTLSGYVQGARLEGDGLAQHIVSDADLARQRQARLAGCIFGEFPAALRWPASVYDADGRPDWQNLFQGWWQQRGQSNYPFEVASRLQWLQTLIVASGQVPLSRMRGEPSREPWYRRLPAPWNEYAERVERNMTQALLNMAGTFTGGTNQRAEVMIHGRRHVLDDMKAGVLRQMAKSVRARAFVSDTGTPDHVYSEHYDVIELPVLVVHGGRDRIANAAVTREVFFDRIASADKEWLFDAEIAHGELEAAPAATERLYPRILGWMDARRASEHHDRA